MNKNIVVLIVSFIVGFIISFLYFNAQYQARATDPVANNTVSEAPEKTTNNTSSTSNAPSKVGALMAFGAKASSEVDKDIPPAETTYKNIQVLKGVPASEILTVMKAFTEGLGVNCTYCHVSTEELDKDDKAMKATARKMLEMVRETNKKYPTNGVVTCYTCHRGAAKPVS
ncbi:MAG: c-type cytochrome [Blastocatellia bacterium]|nr:c-type cytochrome [Blastocatellia bacterium]MBL8196708.1 c-type cytochrome [Blastocatellia bacterium]MBN8724945.1 c-type cytochrome [Acidobacteriota bacterium]